VALPAEGSLSAQSREERQAYPAAPFEVGARMGSPLARQEAVEQAARYGAVAPPRDPRPEGTSLGFRFRPDAELIEAFESLFGRRS
jgi:hypothetical protein